MNCDSGTDNVNPAGATIFAGRLTTPIFGLGLVEQIADGTIQGIAAAQPASIRGNVVMKTVQLPSGGFSRGQNRVARFGWKNVHSTLSDLAGDAYLNEMGNPDPKSPVACGLSPVACSLPLARQSAPGQAPAEDSQSAVDLPPSGWQDSRSPGSDLGRKCSKL